MLSWEATHKDLLGFRASWFRLGVLDTLACTSGHLENGRHGGREEKFRPRIEIPI